MNFKRLISFFLLMCVILTAFACDKPEDNDKDDDPDNTTPPEEYNPYPYEDLSVFMDLPRYDDITITEAFIEEYINIALSRVFSSEDLYVNVTGRACKQWDCVIIDFTGFLNGVAFQGGTATDYPLVLGSKSFIPGFEAAIIGMNIGESKDIPLTFPEDYHSEDLAGEDVVFNVTLKGIKEPPVIDDAFCKEYTTRKDTETFWAMMREECIRSYVWESVLERCVLKEEKPKEYTEFYQTFVSYFSGLAEQQQLPLDNFLKQYGGYFSDYGLYAGIDLETFYAIAVNYAESRLASDLLLHSIIRAEGLKTEGEAYDSAFEELLESNGATKADLISQYGYTTVVTSVMDIQVLRILSSLVTIVD